MQQCHFESKTLEIQHSLINLAMIIHRTFHIFVDFLSLRIEKTKNHEVGTCVQREDIRNTSCFLLVGPHPKRQTSLSINEQKNERQNANASAKSKELHPQTKSRPNAAHLLLFQPKDVKTNKFQIKSISLH